STTRRSSPATARRSRASRATRRSRSGVPSKPSRCCTRAITTITSCCARSSTGGVRTATAAACARAADRFDSQLAAPAMLSLIRVKNYAVVDEIELELEPGFIVMTGETGAGKSILVDALGLALGDRADASIVRPGAERAEISVQFDCPPKHESLTWLRERGLDDGDVCTLRRIVGAEGRSRAFINGQPVTLQDLRALGALLVDIHGQH